MTVQQGKGPPERLAQLKASAVRVKWRRRRQWAARWMGVTMTPRMNPSDQGVGLGLDREDVAGALDLEDVVKEQLLTVLQWHKIDVITDN